jgi:hypothetical protein
MDMSDHEARGRAVYDHTNDDPRPTARRRRPAADWGVGEEIFDRLPGRRFARGDHPRGGADDGRRTIVISGDSVEELPADAGEPDELTRGEFTSRDEALRAHAEHDEVWAGDEPFSGRAERFSGDEAPGRDDEPFAGRDDRADADEPVWDHADHAAHAPSAAARETYARGDQPGRRTVKIGGRPGEHLAFDRPPRRRPPKTVGERVGSRPERVAMWAFALGLILILIAVATAQAGV